MTSGLMITQEYKRSNPTWNRHSTDCSSLEWGSEECWEANVINSDLIVERHVLYLGKLLQRLIWPKHCVESFKTVSDLSWKGKELVPTDEPACGGATKLAMRTAGRGGGRAPILNLGKRVRVKHPRLWLSSGHLWSGTNDKPIGMLGSQRKYKLSFF